ncbi:MAG: hypothetical protein R2699_16105 [Acidimicrobiales bacterium]|nr:hypothetical protein [Acidimicrobiales bacterium]MCB1249982.1 hypothetical protein [Acidimicrobiales bacterium]MCB1261760.1 hypothetical protein [Acidimicrobiales bacterium]
MSAPRPTVPHDRRRRSSRRVRHAWGALAVGTAALVAAGACGSSGRDMRPPAEGATAQTRTPDPTTATSAPSTVGGSVVASITLPPSLPTETMALSSPDWTSGQPLPIDFACGSTTPPTIQWSEAPEGATELVVFASDLDAGEVLWFVTGIPAAVTELDPTAMPPGATARVNDKGTAGWDGPCPTDRNHTVLFELAALPRTVTEGYPTGAAARQALLPDAVAYGSFSAPVGTTSD